MVRAFVLVLTSVAKDCLSVYRVTSRRDRGAPSPQPKHATAVSACYEHRLPLLAVVSSCRFRAAFGGNQVGSLGHSDTGFFVRQPVVPASIRTSVYNCRKHEVDTYRSKASLHHSRRLAVPAEGFRAPSITAVEGSVQRLIYKNLKGSQISYDLQNSSTLRNIHQSQLFNARTL